MHASGHMGIDFGPDGHTYEQFSCVTCMQVTKEYRFQSACDVHINTKAMHTVLASPFPSSQLKDSSREDDHDLQNSTHSPPFQLCVVTCCYIRRRVSK